MIITSHGIFVIITINLNNNFVTIALCTNCTLVVLEVGTNGITDEAAKHLGEMLKTNTRLEGLSLWQNDLTAEVQCDLFHCMLASL